MNRIKPNLFIVGAPKCGTTAWVQYLSSHPDICFSAEKEPHYFNTDFPKFRWARSIEEYLDYFSNCKDAKVVGEASVQYLYSEEAAKNIAHFSPQAKILIFLRSPGSFIRSYHNQLLLNADEQEINLRKAWEMSGSRCDDTLPKGCREIRFLDYKKVGLFSEQLDRYIEHFPATNIKVVFFEDWTNSPRETYLKVLEFLGLNDDGRSDFMHVHGARRVVNYRLNQLVRRPPSVLRWLVAAIRRVPGMKHFRPAQLVRSFNMRPGYMKEKDANLEEEIDRFFAEDQVRLREILKMISLER